MPSSAPAAPAPTTAPKSEGGELTLSNNPARLAAYFIISVSIFCIASAQSW